MADICCPIGHIYVDTTGAYSDIVLGSGTVVTPPDIAACYRVTTNAAGLVSIAIVEPVDPINCPCCNIGFEYSSYGGKCIYITNHLITDVTIPCVTVCICPDPPPPFECTPCTTTNLAISFAFGFTRKQCTDCEVEDLIEDSCFIANTLTNPIISNFRLRNTNLI